MLVVPRDPYLVSFHWSSQQPDGGVRIRNDTNLFGHESQPSASKKVQNRCCERLMELIFMKVKTNYAYRVDRCVRVDSGYARGACHSSMVGRERCEGEALTEWS